MKKLLQKIAPACIALALCALPAVTVANAGKSDVNVADKTSITGQLDKGKWRIAGNVKSVNNAVVFDGDCSEDARITTRSVFKDCSADGIDEIYTSSFTLTIFDIPSGENNRFAVSYGMDKIAGELGEKGTSEVYFVNDNERLKVGVCKFDEESGAKTDIVAPVEYPSLDFGSSFTLNASLVTDGYMTVTIAPAGVSAPYVLCDDATVGNTDHSVSGRVCIGQTAVCEATISAVKIKAYDYTNAATPIELTESFNKDEYNGNAFYTRSDPNDGTNLSGGVKVENGALTFTGRPCFISSVYSYSNFEMTFDLIDVTRKTVTDPANGNVEKEKASGWLGFSLEASTGRGSFDNHARTNILYTMEVEEKISRLYNQLNSNPKMQEYPATYKTVEMDILSEKNEGKVYNYKVSMQDGVFSVWYKLSDSKTYPAEPLFSNDLGYTPYGSIAIMAYGYCGYTFDNIKIVNKDIRPQNVEIEYNGVKNRTEPDFVYADKWSDGDLITNKIGKTTSEKSGCGAALSGFTVLPILGAIAFVKRRKDHE